MTSVAALTALFLFSGLLVGLGVRDCLGGERTRQERLWLVASSPFTFVGVLALGLAIYLLGGL